MIDTDSRGRGMPRPYKTAAFANFYEMRDSVLFASLRRRGIVMDGYPQFLAPGGASSLGSIAIGPLAETFSVLIINLLLAILDTETDFSLSKVCHKSLKFLAKLGCGFCF